jgi:hypothetical protein
MARVTCKLCGKRPARRFCPGERGDICAVCCGQERENTIACPLDCEHLIEARQHERAPELDPRSIPNADVRVTEEFLQAQSPLVMATSQMLFQAAMETPDAIDIDVREALGALIRTFRTLDSGLVYETRPANPMAASIQGRFLASLEELRKQVAERSGVHSIRDKDVMGVLVFWERMELQWNNGRRRSRAFISWLGTAGQ